MSCAEVQIKYQGTGSQSQFNFPFPYQFKSEIIVSLWNNTTKEYEQKLTTDATYPWQITDANPTIVEFTGTLPPVPPTSGINEGAIYNIKIERVTNITDIRSIFNAGSSIRASDLNDNYEQLRFAIIEGRCRVPQPILDYLNEYFWNNYNQTVYSTAGGGTWVSADNRIATTKALDERFQDEADETLISTETWLADDDKIATTQSLENRFDTLIETDILVDGTGLTKSATSGQTTIGIGSNSVDLDRIKTADIVQTADYSTTWTGVNDKVSTVGALEARHDVVVSTSQPTTTQVGKQWLNTTPGNQEFRVWDGSSWRTVAVGQPYTPSVTAIVRYVDATNGSDAADVTGLLPQAPLQSIKRAVDLVNSNNADGSLIVVAPGVYQETLPIQIQRKNVSIVGQALRSCFVQPTQATETNTMFECNSGTLLANMTFVGLKASGTRGNSTYDSDATYGLPENQGWACAFYAGAVIKKSPYIQNCSNFSDSSIDNSVKYDQTNLPAGALGGDTTSGMTGGGILCDGSVPSSSSPLASFVVDSFTQVCLDGPGILCTNNGYAQLVSFFGTFCHYHAKTLNGGQLNLSNCTTDFGRYGLIADGRSTSAVITGQVNGTPGVGAVTITVDGLAAQTGFNTNQPGTTMVMEIGSDVYQVLSATDVTSNTSNVTVYRATSVVPETNLGLKTALTDNQAVTFKLRSYISTGGHTFEYCGSGTDYSAHPNYGGIAVEANQVVELGGTGTTDDQLYNSGKVWQSSTDENGLFKVGDNFKVDQRRGLVTLSGFSIATDLITDLTPQLGGDLDLNTHDITGAGGINITGTDASINTVTVGLGTGNVASNTAVGKDALNSNTTGSSNVAVGRDALKSNTSGPGNTAIGRDSLYNNNTGSNNTGTGFYALRANTSGTGNVANGYEALKSNTSGGTNTATGRNALTSNTTASNNTADGYEALKLNTTGTLNTATGYRALYSNTTGYGNTVDGTQSMYSNTTGAQNTASGYQSLYYNSTGNANTATGYRALRNTTGGYNLASGFEALYSNTTGLNNTATGAYALYSSTTANNNVASGYTALYNNTNGTQHVATGVNALYNNTTGDNCTATGYRALFSNTDGNYNIAYGGYALNSNTTANSNTAVGYNSLYTSTTGTENVAIGRDTLFSTTTGSYNVASGNEALYSNTTGHRNVAIGSLALKTNSTGAYNNAIGRGALTQNTTGTNNVANGYTALYSNTTGASNTSIGHSSLYSNTTGFDNVAVGRHALKSNSTGAYNTATGSQSLQANVTGAGNTANGLQALYSNTYGNYNVANGYQALRSNTTGSNNVASGYTALYANTSGDYNAAYGHESMRFNTTGDYNVATGYQALYNNTTGGFNTVTGVFALKANTTGTENTAHGFQGLFSNTTGNYNTANGKDALKLNTTGTRNTSAGYNSLEANTTGSHNVACGESALIANTTASNNTGIGKAALLSVINGGENTALGNQAGNNITAGARNVCVGSSARPNGASTNDSINIGHDFAGIGSNYFTFGKSGNLVYNQFTSNASWTRSSDVRLKKDIQTNTDLGLGFINDLRTVTYKWKAPSELDASLSGYNADKTEADYTNKMYGFIAQEVKQALDDHNVTDFAGWTADNEDIQGISYEMFVMPLVKAVQELSAENTALKARLDAAGI